MTRDARIPWGLLVGLVVMLLGVRGAAAGPKLSEATHQVFPGLEALEQGTVAPGAVVFNFQGVPVGQDAPEIVRALEELVRLYPETAAAAIRLVGHYAARRRCEDVARVGARAAEQAPVAPAVLIAVGQAYLDCQHTVAAVPVLRRAIALDPTSMAPYLLARAYCMAGRYALCLGASQAYIAQHRDAAEPSLATRAMLVESYNNAGVCLVELGRPGEALTWFEQALALAPQDAWVRKNYERARQQRPRGANGP